jgi:hypothetical protein
LTPTGTEQVLHSFNNNGTDGYLPSAGLIFDAASNLYGTTSTARPTGAAVTATGRCSSYRTFIRAPCVGMVPLSKADVLSGEKGDVARLSFDLGGKMASGLSVQARQ